MSRLMAMRHFDDCLVLFFSQRVHPPLAAMVRSWPRHHHLLLLLFLLLTGLPLASGTTTAATSRGGPPRWILVRTYDIADDSGNGEAATGAGEEASDDERRRILSFWGFSPADGDGGGGARSDRGTDSEEDEDEAARLMARFCRAVDDAASGGLVAGDARAAGAEDGTGLFPSCRLRAAAVPSLRRPDHRGFSPLLPTHVYLYSRPATARSLLPPPVATASSAEQRPALLWDAEKSTGRTIGEEVNGDLSEEERRIVRLVSGEPPADWNNRLMVPGHFRTRLGSAGGMHRDLRHRILLEVDADVTLHVLLHLPRDVFVNVEDAFGEVRGGNVTLVPPPPDDVFIDQEEPAFVSPAHAVWIRIDVQRRKANLPVSVSFNVKLHLRYPLPVAGGDDFRRIVVPPPLIVVDAPQPIVRLSGTDDVQIAWVAAGRQRHGPAVLGLTLAAAAVGAIVMLRDISKVSTWD